MSTAYSPAAGDPGEVRRLRTRLASLLSGIEDLQQETETTIELARFLRADRVRCGLPADTAAVTADLETIMRASTPFPEARPAAATVAELVPAIKKAQQTYDRLIRRHLALAADILDKNAHQA